MSSTAPAGVNSSLLESVRQANADNGGAVAASTQSGMTGKVLSGSLEEDAARFGGDLPNFSHQIDEDLFGAMRDNFFNQNITGAFDGTMLSPFQNTYADALVVNNVGFGNVSATTFSPGNETLNMPKEGASLVNLK